MVDLTTHINLSRCSHCQVAYPSLEMKWQCDTQDHLGQNLRHWTVYQCSYCGSLVTASAGEFREPLIVRFPKRTEINDDGPERHVDLKRAFDILHTPARAVLLVGFAVDAMLKAKGYIDGSLYERIQEASRDHLITAGMASWALQVRLGANHQRPADLDAPSPSSEEAKESVAFAHALATSLQMLPSGFLRGVDYGTKEISV